jgi:hypothetical protein
LGVAPFLTPQVESSLLRGRVMTRIACLLLFSCLAFAAPVPKDAGMNAIYFPTTVGAKWVYEDADGETEEVEVYEVEKDGDSLVVGRRRVGETTPYTKMIVSADGLRQPRDRTGGEIGWILKARAKAGESWEVPDGKRTASGPEEVKVPAGTFKALKVVLETEGQTLTSWYAPGIGEVKRVIKRNGVETVYRSLKSFAEGKK